MGQFQSVVRRYQAAGIVGEIAYHGPQRVTPGELSEDNLENAYIARFFTKSAIDGKYTAGGTIDNDETLFGGIAITPKELVSFGNTDQGPLGATLQIGGNQVIEFMEMGWVWLSASGSEDVRQGMKLIYDTTTGEIDIIAGNATAGTQAEGETGGESTAPTLPEGKAFVPNAVVWRTPGAETTGGMYVAKLTN